MRLATGVWLLLSASMGLAAGIGGYTFFYAHGTSYLTNDPAACTNCHVMNDQFGAWTKSSHRAVATCNDCHTPHGLVGKYTTKGLNGFWHSFYFTTGAYPETIQITGRNRTVTEGACRRCHAAIIDQMVGARSGDDVECLRCHRSVGHLH